MHRRDLILAVYLPTALLATAQGFLLATLPVYASKLNSNYTIVSLVVSGLALGSLVTDLPAGLVLQRIGLKRAMVIGTGLVAICTAMLGVPDNIGWVFALRLAAGVGTTLWGLSRHSFIAQAIPIEERGRSIAVFGGINRIGVFAGPALGGYIGNWFSLEAAFAAAGLLGFAALIVAIRFIPSHVPAIHATLVHNRSERWEIVRHSFRTHGRDVGAAGLAQLFAQMIRQGRQLLIPLIGADLIGLNTAQIGLVMTIAAILDMSLFIPAGYVMDHFGRKCAAVPSFLVMAAGVFLLPLADSYVTLMGIAILIGFGNGLGSGTMMTLGADLAPVGATGEFLGIWRLISDIGQVLGPLAVGVLASQLGLHGSALALAGIGLLAAGTLSFLVRETRRPHAVVAEPANS
jgi:MFS family permease